MYAKIQITGTIEVVTGMHIGVSKAFAAIGAIDLSVMRDARTNLPIIPGSSLKGKMRTLLSKRYSSTLIVKHDDDPEEIKRLFGSAKDKQFKTSRLIFSDSILSNKKQMESQGVQSPTEVKFENTIDRLAARATPRQIERVIRGSEFDFEILYEVDREELIEADFKVIREGLKLLEYDYLGGHGTRGYGKVKFKNLTADCVVGEVSEDILDTCNKILQS